MQEKTPWYNKYLWFVFVVFSIMMIAVIVVESENRCQASSPTLVEAPPQVGRYQICTPRCDIVFRCDTLTGNVECISCDWNDWGEWKHVGK